MDFVIDDGAQLLPVDIKATTQPSTGDLRSLRVFLDDYPEKARAGLILHTGEQTFWTARDILAVPWWRVI